RRLGDPGVRRPRPRPVLRASHRPRPRGRPALRVDARQGVNVLNRAAGHAENIQEAKMRRFGALVVVVAATLALGSGLAACSSGGLGPGEARLTVSSGRAEVAAGAGAWRSAH